MTTLELVFIPSPGAGHLPPTVELAKLLLDHDQRLSVTIIIMNLPAGEAKQVTETPISTPRLNFIYVPNEDSSKDLISPHTFMSAFLEHQEPRLKNIIRDITESDSVRLVGFVVDMFCIAMIDVANEFGVPTYVYFTSSASALGLMFHLQAKCDDEEYDVTDLKDSDLMLSIPSYVKPLPAKLLPSVLFDKQGGSKMFIDLAKKFRESEGIIINSFQELESHGFEFLIKGDRNIPPVFPVGPILNLKNTKNDGKTTDIMAWLDSQPKSSVVFLCFGSMGSFGEKQVKEIAVALERSEHRFLWSLRRPPSKEVMRLPEEYENFKEVLPEGFLERTLNLGKVIGWAPQTPVLSHPSLGGFVSHCGWNSTLESIWFGVPVAAWPLYAEQQINAFQLVMELGIATEIKIDYKSNIGPGGGSNEMLVKADEIESGIRRLMNDDDMRRNVKEMKHKSRLTVTEGGSSYASIKRFIELVITNT